MDQYKRWRCLGALCTVAMALCLFTPARARAQLDVRSQRHLVELGLYLGALFPPDEHELFDLGVGHRRLADAAFHVGARVGYLPWSFIGAEIEGGVMPTRTENDAGAVLYTFRAHLLVQYPARFAPFAVVGGGLLGVASGDSAVGSDVDGGFHWGLGVKVYVTQWLQFRLDARHDLGGKRGPGGRQSFFEILGGASLLLGWRGGTPVAPDGDGDGVVDRADRCPDVAARTADGCPADRDGDTIPDDRDRCPMVYAKTADGCPADRDGDGVADPADKCPTIAARTPDGCPGDSDGDGIRDDLDKCPKVAAKTADGCPLPDRDGDGIPDAQDKCPDQPETRNGFQDDDGCPDTVPKAVKQYTGAIRGITFAFNSAEIRKRSHAVLDKAVRMLRRYKSVQLRVRGHTDNRGKHEVNLKLARLRAQEVVDYLVKKGIDRARLGVEAVGDKEPIADNNTAAGRAKNRRIEFKIVAGKL
ncbi:MAG: OmpA family protein [Myxococcales bacterium]|nr:OmpA family protein [Myxococcales bacterium]